MQHSSERGFIIVAVLWILVALSALATIFSVYLSNSAQALAVTDTGLQTEALVSASLELTTYQLLLAGDKARPALGSFHFRLDNAEVLVNFTSEAARIDLNFASKEMLANLFAVLGADEKIATEAADRIVGWRTQPKANAANEEEALYGAAGLSLFSTTVVLYPCQRTQPRSRRASGTGRPRFAVCDGLQRIAQRRCPDRAARGDRRIARHDACGPE